MNQNNNTSVSQSKSVSPILAPKSNAVSETGDSNTQLNLSLAFDVSSEIDTPDENRRGLDIGCHWLFAYTNKMGCTEKQVQFLVERIRNFGTEIVESDIRMSSPNPNMPTFTKEFKNDWGSSVRVGQDGEGILHAWVTITGDNLELGVSQLEQFKIVYDIYRCGLHLTRFDAAIIDYDKHIKWQQIIDAAQQDNYTGFESSTPQFGKKRKREKVKGFGYIFGSRTSDKYLRVYETFEKHGYRGNKFETEFKGRTARQIGQEIADNYGKLVNSFRTAQDLANWWAEYVIGLVLGSIDFIDTDDKIKSNGSLKKCKRLQWWDKFIKVCGGFRIKVKLPKFRPSLKTVQQWVNRQISPTLAMIYQGLGRDGFLQWAELQARNASQRLSNFQRLGVDILQYQGLSAMKVLPRHSI